MKLVRPGMDTDFLLERFRRERQTLAHLHHKNIALLLDGGATDDGLPYIVMEYIKGSLITDYCSSKDLTIKARLLLFIDICGAVEYAHRHFVIHRDLKPGNIMVDETGTPKLLDFGICKLICSDPMADSETIGSGMRMFTPDYASPEQIRGDGITIASDFYSLGAVLYELLTGAKAHAIVKYTPIGLEEAICERDVRRPSDAVASKCWPASFTGIWITFCCELWRKIRNGAMRRPNSSVTISAAIWTTSLFVPGRPRSDTAQVNSCAGILPEQSR